MFEEHDDGDCEHHEHGLYFRFHMDRSLCSQCGWGQCPFGLDLHGLSLLTSSPLRLHNERVCFKTAPNFVVERRPTTLAQVVRSGSPCIPLRLISGAFALLLPCGPLLMLSMNRLTEIIISRFLDHVKDYFQLFWIDYPLHNQQVTKSRLSDHA